MKQQKLVWQYKSKERLVCTATNSLSCICKKNKRKCGKKKKKCTFRFIVYTEAIAGSQHVVKMSQTRFYSPTSSTVSLRSVIILHVVWPPPSTPAGMPSPLPKSLSQNVDASKTQRARPSSRMKLILSLGQGACYQSVMSSCRVCFVGMLLLI